MSSGHPRRTGHPLYSRLCINSHKLALTLAIALLMYVYACMCALACVDHDSAVLDPRFMTSPNCLRPPSSFCYIVLESELHLNRQRVSVPFHVTSFSSFSGLQCRVHFIYVHSSRVSYNYISIMVIEIRIKVGQYPSKFTKLKFSPCI